MYGDVNAEEDRENTMSIQSKLQSHLLTKLVNFRWVEKRLPQLLVIVLEQKVRVKEHSYQVREKIIIIGKQVPYLFE